MMLVSIESGLQKDNDFELNRTESDHVRMENEQPHIASTCH